MSEIIGKQIEAGLSVEQTRGTAQATAEKWIKNVTANITEKAEHAIDDASHGKLADSDNRRKVKEWVEGDIEGIMQIDFIGYLLYNLLGAVSSSWVATGVYQHVLTVAESIQHASLALFLKDGSAQQVVANNGMINTLELNATVDDYVRFTAGIIAKSAVDNSDTPSYSAIEYDFVGKEVSVKIADTEAGLVGATALTLKEFNLTLDQGLVADHVLGAYNPDDIYNTKMMIEGNFVKNFADETFKDLFLGNDAKYMEITIAGTDNIGGGNYPTMTILLNKVKVMNWDRSGGNDELVTEDVEFKAFWNETDDQQIKITLKNNTAEYDSAPSA